MKNLLTRALLSCVALLPALAHAQEVTQSLTAFDKVVVSPLVSLVLVAGEQEGIRLTYHNIAPEKVNHTVQNKTLRIYLDDAKVTVKQREVTDGDHTYKRPIYDKGVKVTAYVTYRQLNSLEIRGEEEAVCQSELTSPVFSLHVYGQAKVTLASLKANKLKAAFYGENKVVIQSGQVDDQRYRVYGENEIDTEHLIGKNVSAHSYGDSHLRLYASDRIGVMALGESDIQYGGGAQLRKGLVIGDVTIRKAN